MDKSLDNETNDIGLAELVLSLRKELEDIENDPDVKKKKLLQVDSIELELNVNISKSMEGGLSFSIFKAGASYTKGNASIIKMKFTPLPGQSTDKTNGNTAGGKVLMAPVPDVF